MWIFTKHGFVSIVEDRNNLGYLLVRAREQTPLRKLFLGHQIFHTPVADYPYRVRVKQGHVASVIDNEIRKIHYSNFKDSIKDNEDYHDLLMEIWYICNLWYRVCTRLKK